MERQNHGWVFRLLSISSSLLRLWPKLFLFAQIFQLTMSLAVLFSCCQKNLGYVINLILNRPHFLSQALFSTKQFSKKTFLGCCSLNFVSSGLFLKLPQSLDCVINLNLAPASIFHHPLSNWSLTFLDSIYHSINLWIKYWSINPILEPASLFQPPHSLGPRLYRSH